MLAPQPRTGAAARGCCAQRSVRAPASLLSPHASRTHAGVVASATAEETAPVALPRDETMLLGGSKLRVSTCGVGAWSWGDRSGYWGQSASSGYGKDDAKAAFDACASRHAKLEHKRFMYGFGTSEEYTGQFVRSSATPDAFAVATKFAPLPWRLTRDAVPAALRASLVRLRLPKVALYIQHWPGFAFNAWSNDAYLQGLADCVEAGLADTAGVSNFSAERVRGAARALADRGVPLSSNQVQFSLLYRAPERNGVLAACAEAGATLVAYSPLAQGLLTGRYGPGKPAPSGPRAAAFSPARLQKLEALVGLMREIGAGRGGKTPAQVAINWTMVKGALPIPGVKNAAQAADAAGALGWRLTVEECAALERAADAVGVTSPGAPFENW